MGRDFHLRLRVTEAHSNHSDRLTGTFTASHRELEFPERGRRLPAILECADARDGLWMELSAAGMQVSHVRHDGAGACRRGNAYRGPAEGHTSVRESKAHKEGSIGVSIAVGLGRMYLPSRSPAGWRLPPVVCPALARKVLHKSSFPPSQAALRWCGRWEVQRVAS